MKKILNLLLVAAFVTMSMGVIAQPPPPPNDPTNGGGNPPVGTPIGSGMLLLIGMAGLYGGKKVYSLWQEKKD